jgi:hypothetical protein
MPEPCCFYWQTAISRPFHPPASVNCLAWRRKYGALTRLKLARISKREHLRDQPKSVLLVEGKPCEQRNRTDLLKARLLEDSSGRSAYRQQTRGLQALGLDHCRRRNGHLEEKRSGSDQDSSQRVLKNEVQANLDGAKSLTDRAP